MTVLIDLNFKHITYPNGILKNYNVIINEENSYGQRIGSDIKQCREIKKLTAGQGEDYPKKGLLGYVYIKNYYKIIPIDLSRQKAIQKQFSK